MLPYLCNEIVTWYWWILKQHATSVLCMILLGILTDKLSRKRQYYCSVRTIPLQTEDMTTFILLISKFPFIQRFPGQCTISINNYLYETQTQLKTTNLENKQAGKATKSKSKHSPLKCLAKYKRHQKYYNVSKRLTNIEEGVPELKYHCRKGPKPFQTLQVHITILNTGPSCDHVAETILSESEYCESTGLSQLKLCQLSSSLIEASIQS